jgi:CRP/FNR family cyclic AMP-dependent transcriptional regulator
VCWFTGPVDVPRVLLALPDDEARQLLRAARVTTYARREVVVRAGDVADSFHVVLEGRAAVRVTTPAGESAIVTVLGPDSHFGEVSLLGGAEPRRTADVVALERVRTLSIPAAVFHDLRERNPRLERLVTSILAQRVEELSAQLVEALYDGLERRLVRRLVSLAGTFAGSATDVVVPLTQDELAQLAGGARPSVNQVLRRLEDAGVVRLSRGRVTVLDVSALRARLAG